MILTKALFPSPEICNEEEMYYKGHGYSIVDDGSVSFAEGGMLSTSTYFNSFSLSKWTKYTMIDNLKLTLVLKGDFNVSLCSISLKGKEVSEKVISAVDFSSEDKETLEIECPVDEKGVLFWKLQAAKEGSAFYGFDYSSDVENVEINRVKIAIGICTFKREEYVIKNLERLSSVISFPDSPLYCNARVFVSDNGQTLPKEELENDIVKVVYNKNYGGAGGFTRTLLEAMNEDAECDFTNFIFMDDDIILDVAAVERTCNFLALLKPEWKKSVIGGAMFSTDDRYLQFENGAKWVNNGFRFHLRDVDMRTNLNILLNESDRDVNYNAWCYCCIPFEIVKDNNLPLPVFFHMDDVEYGLRNGLPVLSLNGINVWHLYKKSLINPKNDYYDIRNRLIMLAELQPGMVSALAHTYLSSFTAEIFKHHYARAINAFDGILDFCKGFDYFASLDTLEQHGRLFSNVKWVEAGETERRDAVVSKRDGYGKKFKLKALLTLLFKPKKKRVVVYGDNGVNDAVGAKEVCVFNLQENKCISYKKNLSLFVKCSVKYLKVKRAIKRKLKWATEDFGNKIAQVKNIDFWNKYLELPERQYDKKVLFVASDNDKTSGAFRSMSVLASLLRDEHNICPVVLLPKRGDGESFLRELDIRYITIPSEDWIVRLDDSRKTVFAKKRRMSSTNKKAYKLYKTFLEKNKFDVIHINTSYHYAIAEVAKEMGIPLVWHLREFLEEDQKRRFVNKGKAYDLMNTSNKVVAISDSLKAKYASAFGDKLVRIYNGVSVDTYLNEEKTIFNEEKVTFVCTGAMVEYKGQHLLLEACGKLKQAGKLDNFEILFAGNNKGPYMQTIDALIKQYDLSKNVKILGRRNDVEKLYEKSDIMFVGSRSEAFGRITVEAMLSGCLLIGANTSGTSEIVKDGVSGLLFEHGNTEDLADKIEYALANKEQMKKLAEAGRDFVRETYPADKNADAIAALYKEIC